METTISTLENFFKNHSNYFELVKPYFGNHTTYMCNSTHVLNSDDFEDRFFIIYNNEILEIFEDRFENITTKKVSINELLKDIEYGFILLK